jgi:hypothetical protein
MGMRARGLRLRNHYHNRNHGHIQVRIEGLIRLLIRGSDSVPLFPVPFLLGILCLFFRFFLDSSPILCCRRELDMDTDDTDDGSD